MHKTFLSVKAANVSGKKMVDVALVKEEIKIAA